MRYSASLTRVWVKEMEMGVPASMAVRGWRSGIVVDSLLVLLLELLGPHPGKCTVYSRCIWSDPGVSHPEALQQGSFQLVELCCYNYRGGCGGSPPTIMEAS